MYLNSSTFVSGPMITCSWRATHLPTASSTLTAVETVCLWRCTYVRIQYTWTLCRTGLELCWPLCCCPTLACAEHGVVLRSLRGQQATSCHGNWLLANVLSSLLQCQSAVSVGVPNPVSSSNLYRKANCSSDLVVTLWVWVWVWVWVWRLMSIDCLGAYDWNMNLLKLNYN